MSQHPTASEWRGARGDKWRAKLIPMEATLAPIDDPLIDALRLDAPAAIAEVGCGGGGTSLAILRRAPAGSVVHGFDISPALIEVARGRIPADERRIAFDIADVATAPAPAKPYARLASRFSLMFFDDPPAAFANLAGWLATGGRFAFAAWAGLGENPWMTTVRDAVAEVVEIPPTEPDAPGPFRYSDADKLLTLLDRAGFRDLGVDDWRGALPIGGGLPAAEAATFALKAFSAFGELLAAAGDAAVDDASERLTRRFSQHERNGVVYMDACVHIFTGAGR